MKLMPEHFATKALATILLLGVTSFALAKGPLFDSPKPPTGWKPIPCRDIQVCGNTSTYSSCDWHGLADDQGSPAHQFLVAFAPALRLDESKLRPMEVKSGLTSIISRFEQVYENRRVFGAEVAVITDKDGRIREVRNSYFPIERVLGSGVPAITAEAAEAVGLTAIGIPVIGLAEQRLPSRSELVWFPIAGTGVALLAWELMIHGQTPFPGDYLTLVDANSGVLLFEENRLVMSN